MENFADFLNCIALLFLSETLIGHSFCWQQLQLRYYSLSLSNFSFDSGIPPISTDLVKYSIALSVLD